MANFRAKKVVRFTPKQVVHFAPEWVVHFTPEWVVHYERNHQSESVFFQKFFVLKFLLDFTVNKILFPSGNPAFYGAVGTDGVACGYSV